jgi:hypothetical protein
MLNVFSQAQSYVRSSLTEQPQRFGRVEEHRGLPLAMPGLRLIF